MRLGVSEPIGRSLFTVVFTNSPSNEWRSPIWKKNFFMPSLHTVVTFRIWVCSGFSGFCRLWLQIEQTGVELIFAWLDKLYWFFFAACNKSPYLGSTIWASELLSLLVPFVWCSGTSTGVPLPNSFSTSFLLSEINQYLCPHCHRIFVWEIFWDFYKSVFNGCCL